MCFTFLYYYPATELVLTSGQQLVSKEFTSQNFKYAAFGHK